MRKKNIDFISKFCSTELLIPNSLEKYLKPLNDGDSEWVRNWIKEEIDNRKDGVFKEEIVSIVKDVENKVINISTEGGVSLLY